MGLDSIELIIEVENHFSISIPDPEAEKAHTVGLLVECVANILNIKEYNFSLRESTFHLIKSSLLDLNTDSSDFTLNDRVAEYLDLEDKGLLKELESKLQLKLPGVDTKIDDRKGILSKVHKWFDFTESIDFKTIKWKKYTDILLSHNLDKYNPPIAYTSKYEIYIAIMRITVDKIGVDYEEIGIEKSFTDDLGVD